MGIFVTTSEKVDNEKVDNKEVKHVEFPTSFSIHQSEGESFHHANNMDLLFPVRLLI